MYKYSKKMKKGQKVKLDIKYKKRILLLATEEHLEKIYTIIDEKFDIEDILLEYDEGRICRFNKNWLIPA